MAARLCKLTGKPVDAKPWSGLGYYGQQIGKVAFGSSSQGALLQASGHTAHELMELGPQWVNCSRLDVQATLWFERGGPELPLYMARASLAAREGAMGTPWQVTSIDGHGKGNTTYIGSRTSEVYVRIYDKGAESGDEDYEGAVRFEAEYKGKAATRILNDTEGVLPCAEWWYSVVARTLLRRGISLPAVSELAYIPTPDDEPAVSDEARRLAWLAGSVAGVVAKLIAGGVDRGLIVDTLGLSEYTSGLRKAISQAEWDSFADMIERARDAS
jgi:hypothetical protein